MIVIMLMCLIILWLLSGGIFIMLGFYIAKQKYSGKRKNAAIKEIPLTEQETYLRDKKQREEENFWNYDGTEQESG